MGIFQKVIKLYNLVYFLLALIIRFLRYCYRKGSPLWTKDFDAYDREHSKLYTEAQKTSDYSKAVMHYYDFVTGFLLSMWGEYLHFVPHNMTSKTGVDTRGCNYHQSFNRYIATKLNVKEGDRILEVGCGSGFITRSIAEYTKAQSTGLTLSDVEIEVFRNQVKKLGMKNCDVMKGDYHDLPFERNTFEASYGIYCLKYSAKLDRVFKEASKVLKPGGRFVSYELLLTDKYDHNNKVHKELSWNISFLTGMPPLWTVAEFRRLAEENGFKVEEDELSTKEDPWFYDLGVLIPFANLFWYAAPVMETIFLLPKGFTKWYKTHIYPCFYSIYESGRIGILDGSRTFILTKA